MADASQSTATVTVGCKLPNGLHMDVNGRRVTLAGTNAALLIGGHGITPGVPRDFWEAWKKQHADAPMVKDGFVFAHEKADHAAGLAKERAAVKTGFEGLNPDKPAPGITRETTAAVV